MRRLSLLALACALVLHGPALARRFTVDDLLGLEQLGSARFTPDGRWSVIQTFAPWDQAPRYDLDWWTLYGLGRLTRVDLRDGAVRPLLPLEAGCGYVAGPFSPSGERMAVYRLCGHAWELGVVGLAGGEARWLGLSPELPQWGRAVAWRDDDELVVIAQPHDPVGHRLGYGWQAQARLAQAWADAAEGRLAVNAFGSGRYRSLRAKGPPRRLVAVRLSNGQVRTLANDDFFDLEIAPGGRTVAALADAEDLQALQGPASSGMPPRRRRLMLADLRTGATAEPCPSCDVMQGLLTWSRSGERLLVYARQGVAWADGGFQIIDARTVKATPAPLPGLSPALVHKRNRGELAAGAWLGDTPVVYARPAGTAGRADWYAVGAAGPRPLTSRLTSPGPRLLAVDAGCLTVEDGEAAWRVEANGTARRLPVPTANLFRRDGVPDAERLAISAPTPSSHLMVRTATRIGALGSQARLPLKAGETPLTVSPDAARAIVSATDPHGVGRVVLRQIGHADRLLLEVNDALDAVEPATVRAIRHKGPDGQDLTSWLYLPPEMAPGVKPPLVAIPYPGEELAAAPPGQAPGSSRLYNSAQLLAGRGYAVLVPSLPYAKGREPMDGLANQVLAAVDAAAAQAPVDAGRLAVWGHSYGGYAALAIATQSARFKAVIASASASNLTSFYAGLSLYNYAVPEAGLPVLASAGWSESGQARMNAPPWQDPERYRRNSPIAFADRIKAPVMLIHGDMDKDPAQSEQLFTSLYRQNKDAVLLLYRGESHVILSPANVRDEYARVFSFLEENIGVGAPAHWTSH